MAVSALRAVDEIAFFALPACSFVTCRELRQPPQSAHRMTSATLRVVDSLAAIPPSRWDALVGARPLLSHAFLHALHETGCASRAAVSAATDSAESCCCPALEHGVPQ